MDVVITKLIRRQNPENPASPEIYTGQRTQGVFMVPTQLACDIMDKKVAHPDSARIADLYEEAAEFKPKIGYPVFVYHRNGGWLKTSIIRAYHIHETDGDAPDKLVLPKGFPVEDIVEMPSGYLQPEDMLLATMNSIYHIRKCK